MLRRIALTLFALCLPGLALAQGWVPERPVRIILPFPPGGSTDLVGRILADRVSRSALMTPNYAAKTDNQTQVNTQLESIRQSDNPQPRINEGDKV